MRVFEWTGTKWVQKGTTIYGTTPEQYFGYSVSLSGDGSMLTAGSDVPAQQQGTLQSFELVDASGKWQSFGSKFSTGSASIGRLSLDGSILAVSSINGGRDVFIETNVYQFQGTQLQCQEDEFLLRLSLLMDAAAKEVTWRIDDEEGNPVYPNDDGTELFDFTPIVHEWCVKRQQCLTIKLFDEGGDGFCCSKGAGAYVVWVDGIEVASGGDFHWYEEVRVGSCKEKCPDETSLFQLELALDNDGSESKWEIKDEFGRIIGAPDEAYPDDAKGQIYIEEACLPTDACSTFTIYEDCEGLQLFGNPECGLGFDNLAGYRFTFEGIEQGNSHDFRLSRDYGVGRCPSRCEDGMLLLHFLLRTDAYGAETTWEVLSENGDILLQGGPYASIIHTSVVEELCIDTVNDCTTVTVYDSAGDGMTGPLGGVGGFSIQLDYEEYKFGGTFELSDTTRIGNCGMTDAPAALPSAQTNVPTTRPSLALTLPPSPKPTPFPSTELMFSGSIVNATLGPKDMNTTGN